jgi:AbiJ N-terminal domain 4
MAIDSPKKPFSKRYGYRSQPKEITVWEDAPENLRHFVLEAAGTVGYGPSDVRNLICSVLHRRPDPNNWSEYPNVWGEAQELAYGCEWFKFYDFVEEICRSLANSTAENAQERSAQFQDALNEFFVDEGIGWQMVDGEIVTRGTETFESSVHGAVEALQAAARLSARDEIHEALSDLSRRPEADLTGAIQHAMAALECVARDVCGDERATLGEIIKRYPGTIPKPLDDSVAKAWGYASEVARHIREGHKPERKDVELIVSLAATVATYLSR